MPIHDWTRVSAGTFHHFHHTWVTELTRAIKPLLPEGYYVLAEQVAGQLGPDVLTLEISPPPPRPKGGTPGTTALAVQPPRVAVTQELDEEEAYAARQKSLVIRHSSEDQIVALVEVVSPGNKSSEEAFRKFRRKTTGAVQAGIHLLILDLHPPGPRDPQGIHTALWAELGGKPVQPPADKPLTLVAYSAGDRKRAYVQPVAVGDVLPEMPLFLDPEEYITVPLERPYLNAFADVPAHLQRQLQSGPGSS